MRFTVAIVAAIVAAVSAAPLTEEQYQALFQRFVSLYGKNYATNEFFAKYNTFKANFEGIVAHNAKSSSWSQSVNEFADLSSTEFAAKMGLRTIKAPQASQLATESNETRTRNGDSFDWRDEGAVNKIKNQGQCGSCWAFSANAALEGSVFVSSGKLLDFAESELVDCSTSYGNHGCNGGLMTQAFEYMIDNSLTVTSEYPYVAKDGACKSKGTSRVAKVTSYKNLATTEKALLAAVDQQVVAVAVDASALQFYSGGIIDEKCAGRLNHGIALVGYGVEGSTKFSILRNSWGTSWGEQGYFRLQQGINGLCYTQMNTIVEATA